MDKICSKCQILLVPKEENDTIFVECKNCGFKEEYKDWVHHQCPKCSGGKAAILYHAMFRGDEGTTTMYKCLNCGSVDKDGFKGG